ncbi:hypothetical protein GGR50DRAFT_572687 [Xylaria sp. CBS 124048]|nr:hypothetical protein GGR50DRAFT_572687 [Xylaria sp. CBS 124048]
MAAAGVQPRGTNPFKTSPSALNHDDNVRDEWEDWEEDSDDDHSSSHPTPLLIDLSDGTSGAKTRKSLNKTTGNRMTAQRSLQLHRVKSRAQQKAQIARAGITLITDMTQFNQRKAVAQLRGASATTPRKKFADLAALQALEGKPSSPSIGSFAWLKQRPGNMRSTQQLSASSVNRSPDLSPVSRPIVIGISVPSEDLASHQVSPHTAVIETPVEAQRKLGGKPPTPRQLCSVWSPDTEVSESPCSAVKSALSVHSHEAIFGRSEMASGRPPFPTLPIDTSEKQAKGPQDQYDEDSDTPCTPFEEDGPKPQQLKASIASPDSASSAAHGWWDHVTTPFVPHSNNPFKVQPRQPVSSSTPTLEEWWNKSNEKTGSSSRASRTATITPLKQEGKGGSTLEVDKPREQSHSEKARVLLEENRSNDAPPPYEPPNPHTDTKAAFPQSYAIPQPIPSPGPMTPGLPGTMTSQGGIKLADLPSELHPPPNAVLPDRAAGSYRTGDHFYEAPGMANKTERQRRRHEKEDVVARKVGGFWRGRGCIPEDGCFGRSGREGRKRRRVCLGILGGAIASIILVIVLVVVLTQRAMSPVAGKSTAPDAAPDSTPVPEPTYWLNLTSFPPMPTGVLTVAGPNNSVAVSGCFNDDTTPSTAWSCALPKENQDSVAPYKANQPEFIFQIQFDNSSQALWKLAGVDPKERFVADAGFKPDPAPPSLVEMAFLGNTTDGIKSDWKEGEPTPFFISLLESIDQTVGPNVLERRQGNAIGGAGGNGTGSFNLTAILPDPKLNADGTGASAQLFPLPVQQPLRLFDRDLPTEHYGFYTFFDKTIYMANSTHRDPADENGGVPIADAKALVTLAQTRFLVKIWTRLGNTSQIIGSGDPSVNVTATPSVQPGTMPYPVTVIEDSHGGNPSSKIDFTYGVLSNNAINQTDAREVVMNIGYRGTLINPRGNDVDPSLGGIDGGTGGCKCEWVNFQSI